MISKGAGSLVIVYLFLLMERCWMFAVDCLVLAYKGNNPFGVLHSSSTAGVLVQCKQSPNSDCCGPFDRSGVISESWAQHVIITSLVGCFPVFRLLSIVG